jgi:pimeloyl-ACP methyl ester carboxylesterase
MLRATVNGINLAFKDYGTGFPILCLHGGMGIDSSYLDSLGIRELANKNCRVIIFDQRGHGQSDRSDDNHYTHRQWIEDARALAPHLKLGKFVLLGHSYGLRLRRKFCRVGKTSRVFESD